MSFAPPRKSLSQHFLVDDNIARNIIRDLRLLPDDLVIEIGPGRGALTKHLARAARTLVAVEIDSRAAETLAEQFRSPGVTIIHGDFLDVDLRAVHAREGKRIRLVGNIPYHLTSSILMKAFDEREALRDFTFMVQREVARRLAAQPGTKTYGILSGYAAFYGDLRILFNVSPNCFFPKPKVSSAVVQETFRTTVPQGVNEQFFRTVVRTAFGKRRKTLRNALTYLPFGTEAVRKLSALPMLQKRPEQLSVAQFVELTNLLESFHA